MKNFNQRGAGNRNFSKNNDKDRRYEPRREGRPEMFKAVCADCGKPCEIPFKPNNSRPVFCSTCFSEHNEGSDRSDRPDFKRKEMFEATCDKCGKRCEVPFKPVSGKPVFCSQCFDRDNGGRDNRDSRDGGGRDRAPRDNNHDHDHNHNNSNNNDIYQERFEKLNAKLDMILNALNPKAPSDLKPEKVKAEIKEVKAVKTKKAEIKVAAPKKTIVKKLDKKRKK